MADFIPRLDQNVVNKNELKMKWNASVFLLETARRGVSEGEKIIMNCSVFNH